MMGHSAQPRQRVSHGGIPDAQDLHAGLRILRTSGALPEVYQGIYQPSTCMMC